MGQTWIQWPGVLHRRQTYPSGGVDSALRFLVPSSGVAVAVSNSPMIRSPNRLMSLYVRCYRTMLAIAMVLHVCMACIHCCMQMQGCRDAGRGHNSQEDGMDG